MIVSIGGEKGGTGQSTIAHNLAVFLPVKKNMYYLLLDIDPQKNSIEELNYRTEYPK